MQIFGRTKRGRLVELGEVTFSVEPADLVRLIRFLEKSSAELQSMGTAFGHVHLQDFEPDSETAGSGPDVVVHRAS